MVLYYYSLAATQDPDPAVRPRSKKDFPQRDVYLVETRVAAHFLESSRSLLEAVARGEQVPSVFKPSPGRSACLHLSNGTIVKTKGLIGVRRIDNGSDFEVVGRTPEKRYRDPPELHIALDKSLALTAAAGRPKALFSLSARNAEREFDCQYRLGLVDAGLGPLAVFRFQTLGGLAELDCNGEETGFVVLKYDTCLKPVSPRIYRVLVRDVPASKVTHAGDEAALSEDAYLTLLDEVSTVYNELGETRRKAVFEAGVLRHAGHLENFLIDAHGRMLVVDTDTCILAEELTTEQLGIQLLRDLLSDILRMAANVSLLHWNSAFKQALDTGRVDPFGAYLTGLLGTLVSAESLQTAARRLRQSYGAWLVEYEPILGPLSESFAQDWGKDAPHRTFTGNKWRRLHTFFAPDCLSVLYDLLISVADERTFMLPPVNPEEARILWLQGANTFVRRFILA